MILYAVKYGDRYLRDRQDREPELLDIDHCSVFTNRGAARAAAARCGRPHARLIEFTLQEKEIPW